MEVFDKSKRVHSFHNAQLIANRDNSNRIYKVYDKRLNTKEFVIAQTTEFYATYIAWKKTHPYLVASEMLYGAPIKVHVIIEYNKSANPTAKNNVLFDVITGEIIKCLTYVSNGCVLLKQSDFLFANLSTKSVEKILIVLNSPQCVVVKDTDALKALYQIIGRELWNQKCYVLDKKGNRVLPINIEQLCENHLELYVENGRNSGSIEMDPFKFIGRFNDTRLNLLLIPHDIIIAKNTVNPKYKVFEQQSFNCILLSSKVACLLKIPPANAIGHSAQYWSGFCPSFPGTEQMLLLSLFNGNESIKFFRFFLKVQNDGNYELTFMTKENHCFHSNRKHQTSIPCVKLLSGIKLEMHCSNRECLKQGKIEKEVNSLIENGALHEIASLLKSVKLPTDKRSC